MLEQDICEVETIHSKAIQEAKLNLPRDKVVLKLSKRFKVLGEPTRVKILFAVSNRELCVCDIAEILSATPSAISHQLRILRDLKWVKFRKEGKLVYYTLADKHITNLIDMSVKHAIE